MPLKDSKKKPKSFARVGFLVNYQNMKNRLPSRHYALTQ